MRTRYRATFCYSTDIDKKKKKKMKKEEEEKYKKKEEGEILKATWEKELLEIY